MAGLLAEPKFVGREAEFATLLRHLEAAIGGAGGFVLVSGEAGIGKTRLLDELKGAAQARNVQVLTASCAYGSLTPYMPILEALRSGGLEALFAEDVPRVDAAYLMTESGLLIQEILRQESRLDPSLFAAMLTTVGHFVQESLSLLEARESGESLNRLGFGGYTILIERGEHAILAAIVAGRENEFLVQDMRDILRHAEESHGRVLENWSGEEETVARIGDLLRPLISSGRYDGIDHAKGDPKARRNLLFDHVSLGLMRRAQVSPLLLCIEDLQWADSSSLALLHHVAKNARDCGVLIVGSYRPEDLGVDGGAHPLTNTIQRMQRQALLDHLPLGRLSEPGTASLIRSGLESDRLDEALVKRIFRETEGNPLFILELLRLMCEEGILVLHGETWTFRADGARVTIPSLLRDVLSQRLSLADEETREILDVASVIGEEFGTDLLAEALNMPSVRLLKKLRTLEQRHRLVRSYNEAYRFDHVKMKEVLYEELPTALREEYHGMVADAIEKRHWGNLEQVVGDLAFHRFRSKNRREALPYLLRAAKKAFQQSAYYEGIKLHLDALTLDLDRETMLTVLSDLGDLYVSTGDYDKSLRCYERALELAQERELRADLLRGIAFIHKTKGRDEEALRLYDQALSLVQGDERREAQVLGNIALMHLFKGAYNKTVALCDRWLGIAGKLGDERGRYGALHLLGIVSQTRGRLDAALKYYKESLALAEKIGPIEEVLWILLQIGYTHLDRREYAQALQPLQKASGMSRRLGDRWVLPLIYCGIAEAHVGRGDLNSAVDACNRAFALSKETDAPEGLAFSQKVFGMVRREQREWDEAIEHFEACIDVSRKMGRPYELARAYHEYGLMWKARGDRGKAMEYLGMALDTYHRLGLGMWASRAEEALSDIPHTKGGPGRTRQVDQWA